MYSKNSDRSDRNEYRNDRGDRSERPARAKVAKTSASGKVFVDYKETETLKRTMAHNGKMYGRKRNGVNAHEQRLITAAIKRARYMGLLPYVGSSQA